MYPWQWLPGASSCKNLRIESLYSTPFLEGDILCDALIWKRLFSVMSDLEEDIFYDYLLFGPGFCYIVNAVLELNILLP